MELDRDFFDIWSEPVHLSSKVGLSYVITLRIFLSKNANEPNYALLRFIKIYYEYMGYGSSKHKIQKSDEIKYTLSYR